MKIFLIYLLLIIAAAGVVVNADWIDGIRNDRITDCRPPSDEDEKLVATLTKSNDGGALELHCEYHSTLGVVK